jgi:hypothetical protein
MTKVGSCGQFLLRQGQDAKLYHKFALFLPPMMYMKKLK